MADTFDYTPAQHVGMALSHARKAVDFLDKAVEQDAVVLPRDAVERIRNGAREIASGDLHTGEMTDEAISIAETLDPYLS